MCTTFFPAYSHANSIKRRIVAPKIHAICKPTGHRSSLRWTDGHGRRGLRGLGRTDACGRGHGHGEPSYINGPVARILDTALSPYPDTCIPLQPTAYPNKQRPTPKLPFPGGHWRTPSYTRTRLRSFACLLTTAVG